MIQNILGLLPIKIWKGIIGIRDLAEILSGIRENAKILDGLLLVHRFLRFRSVLQNEVP